MQKRKQTKPLSVICILILAISLVAGSIMVYANDAAREADYIAEEESSAADTVIEKITETAASVEGAAEAETFTDEPEVPEAITEASSESEIKTEEPETTQAAIETVPEPDLTTKEVNETETAAPKTDETTKPEETSNGPEATVDFYVNSYVELQEAPAGGLRSAVSSNLSDFLTDVVIDAPVDGSGNYVINPDSTYEITFNFNENENTQFDDEAIFTYIFPQGVLISDSLNTTFDIIITDENGTVKLTDNSCSVSGGVMSVYFNKSDPAFERLKATPNVKFSISLSSKFSSDAGTITFNENVVKNFVFEETSDLSINKNVVYDMDNDRADYELQIHSAGHNDNLVIEDHLTGTALIFNKDVTVTSNINGALNIQADYNSVENGFKVSIPQTSDGEILTLRYSAAVDNNKISSNGTVEQTNNTARVTSDQVPEGKEDSADFAGQAKFQRVTKTAFGDTVQTGENLYEQTWTVLVNQDHKMNMGGNTISDWIVQNSRPFMQFTGDGLTIKVTFEDGSVEMRDVSWDDLYIWESSTGKWGWRYLAPETDGKASYYIICTTQINTKDALGDLNLANGAQILNSYDEAEIKISVTNGNSLGIKKEAVGTTSEDSEWKVTVTVPGSGLPEFHIVDDGPKLTYEGESYIDIALEDSFTVEGLHDPESWRLRIGSDGRTFTINFYTSKNQSEENKGILPTEDGMPRDIVIRYKTAVNQDWLDLAADDGYVSSTLYRHRNYACAWSGTYRTPTVDASVRPVKPTLEKSLVERSEIEIDGEEYPLFSYTLLLSGPTADGMHILDSFDTSYLRLYPDTGIRILGGASTPPTIGGGSAAAADTADGIDIIVNSFPKQSDGSFYPYYQISYDLIVKDKAALTQLNAAAAASQDGVDLENTATWGTLSSSEVVNYTYFPYVDKELLTRPSQDNGYVAEFKVIINKYAEDLDPASDVLNIQDVLSPQLRFLPDSLVITPSVDSIGISYDSETNTLTLTDVPDETTFEITYQARVLGSGNVSYSNTVKFGNFEKTVEEETVVSSSGGGTASNPSITLVKRDRSNIQNVLAGAVYQLYYEQDGEAIPVVDRNGQNVTFTTASDGKALIIGNLQLYGWTLWAERTYCLVEIQAPAGYAINDEPVRFILSETPSSQMEYDISGNQIDVYDDEETISVSVTKQWVGKESDSVTIWLLADKQDLINVSLTSDSSWMYTFENLPKYDKEDGHEISYSIREEELTGYSTSYSGSAEEGFIVTNTENPETPTEPTTPENPTDPTEPTTEEPTPEEPTKPDKPTEPTTPEPTTPAKPAQPDEPTTEKPTTPAKPVKPTQISTEKPTATKASEKPTETKKDTKKETRKTPQTSDDSGLLVYLILFAGCIAICIWLIISRIRPRKKRR